METVNNLLKDGNYGLALYKKDIPKYPYHLFSNPGCIDDMMKLFRAFVVVNNIIVFQDGCYQDNLEDFSYITDDTSRLEHVPHSYVITHIFPGGRGFTEVYSKLIQWERYHDTDDFESKPIYVSHLVPRYMTKKQIEEALGYPFILNENEFD